MSRAETGVRLRHGHSGTLSLSFPCHRNLGEGRPSPSEAERAAGDAGGQRPWYLVPIRHAEAQTSEVEPHRWEAGWNLANLGCVTTSLCRTPLTLPDITHQGGSAQPSCPRGHLAKPGDSLACHWGWGMPATRGGDQRCCKMTRGAPDSPLRSDQPARQQRR